MVGLTLGDAKLIVKALEEQLRLHRRLGLDCISPPVVTSYYMHRRGVPDSQLRRFWHRIGNEYQYTIYQRGSVSAQVVLRHEKGIAYHDEETAVPVDPFTCRKLPGCIVVSNTNKLYLFIQVTADENMMRLSALKMLCLMESNMEGSGLHLLQALRGALEGGSEQVRELVDVISTLLAVFQPLIKALNPLLPRDIETALSGSPPLRTLLRLLSAKLVNGS